MAISIHTATSCARRTDQKSFVEKRRNQILTFRGLDPVWDFGAEKDQQQFESRIGGDSKSKQGVPENDFFLVIGDSDIRTFHRTYNLTTPSIDRDVEREQNLDLKIFAGAPRGKQRHPLMTGGAVTKHAGAYATDQRPADVVEIPLDQQMRLDNVGWLEDNDRNPRQQRFDKQKWVSWFRHGSRKNPVQEAAATAEKLARAERIANARAAAKRSQKIRHHRVTCIHHRNAPKYCQEARERVRAKHFPPQALEESNDRAKFSKNAAPTQMFGVSESRSIEANNNTKTKQSMAYRLFGDGDDGNDGDDGDDDGESNNNNNNSRARGEQHRNHHRENFLKNYFQTFFDHGEGGDDEGGDGGGGGGGEGGGDDENTFMTDVSLSMSKTMNKMQQQDEDDQQLPVADWTRLCSCTPRSTDDEGSCGGGDDLGYSLDDDDDPHHQRQQQHQHQHQQHGDGDSSVVGSGAPIPATVLNNNLFPRPLPSPRGGTSSKNRVASTIISRASRREQRRHASAAALALDPEAAVPYELSALRAQRNLDKFRRSRNEVESLRAHQLSTTLSLREASRDILLGRARSQLEEAVVRPASQLAMKWSRSRSVTPMKEMRRQMNLQTSAQLGTEFEGHQSRCVSEQLGRITPIPSVWTSGKAVRRMDSVLDIQHNTPSSSSLGRGSSIDRRGGGGASGVASRANNNNTPTPGASAAFG